jgi:hypothetical protein
MKLGARDLGQIRMANALILSDDSVRATVKHPDAATLRGLEGRFAERLQIQPSYWSQIKGRSRQIGERLARQFEGLCHKPPGWMDEVHDARPARPSTISAKATAPSSGTAVSPGAAGRDGDDDSTRTVPRDDDERFIVGLVLSYYRRHPQRARSRLLELLGEVLMPTSPTAAPTRRPRVTTDDGADLWSRTQAGIKPLKKRR